MTLLSDVIVFFSATLRRVHQHHLYNFTGTRPIPSGKCFFPKFANYLIRFAVNQRNFSCSFIVKPYAHVITATWLITITCRKLQTQTVTKRGRKIYEWTFSIKVRQSKAQSWNGAQAESLIDARLSEDHELTIATPTVLLDQVSASLILLSLEKSERNFTTFNRKLLRILRPTSLELWTCMVKLNFWTTLIFSPWIRSFIAVRTNHVEAS